MMPAITAAEYEERTRDENKARELHPADAGRIDLDAFTLMSEDGRRRCWALADDADKRGLALQIIRRKGHGPDEATIGLYMELCEQWFGPSPVDRMVMGALEQLAESHQRSAETAPTGQRGHFQRWAGAYRCGLRHWTQGARPEQTEAGGWQVASATRAGLVHRVGRGGQCSCEARGRGCWHAALVAGIETAYDGSGA